MHGVVGCNALQNHTGSEHVVSSTSPGSRQAVWLWARETAFASASNTDAIVSVVDLYSYSETEIKFCYTYSLPM